ncbi:MAG TPA: hypothetical protein O0X70_07120, partial [Methanocorpusculum sp.]|nr:hypothetical protein [Methanocorpusculum sp.]
YVGMDEYLSQKDIPRLYSFYEYIADDTQKNVFILGDSFVGYYIYSPMVNEQLKEKGYDITEYNLGLGNACPLLYALQTNKIIKASPSLVIMGITYRTLDEWDAGEWKSHSEERANLGSRDLDVDFECLSLYSSDELRDVFGAYFWYNKKFLEGSMKYKQQTNGTVSNSNPIYNNYYKLGAKRASMTHSDDELVRAALNPNNPFRPELTADETNNKRALKYMIKKFNEHNIPVVIINSPLHSLLSENISDESHENLRIFLDSTGVTWYDMENTISDEHFIDIYHGDEEAMLEFTPWVTDMIVAEIG